MYLNHENVYPLEGKAIICTSNSSTGDASANKNFVLEEEKCDKKLA